MAKIYRAGLIGCGRMGATIDDEVRDRPNSHLFLPYSHAAAVVACPRTELVAVCDPIEEKSLQIKERYQAKKAYSDYQEMIRAEGLDMVCIATRPSPHAETAVFAAENEVKGIYCEKPLCNSMAEADQILAACRRHGVKFNYGTQRRYVPMYQNVRQLIEAGELGEVQAIVGHCGVGAAQWGHTHAADMLLYLAGDGEVEYVQGTILAEEGDWDGDVLKVDPPIASAYVQFKNGVRAYLVGDGGYEFEVGGSKAKLRTQDNGMNYSLRKVGEGGEFAEVNPPQVPIVSGTLKAIEDLVRALDEDGETQGDIAFACRSQEIVLGIIASHRRGGARVELPLADRNMAVAPDHY